MAARVPLSERQRAALVEHLGREITTAREGMSARRDKIKRWNALLEGKSQKKSWQSLGPRSSNLFVPMPAIIADSVEVRVLNAFFGQDRDLNVEAMIDGPSGANDPETGRPLAWSDIAADLERYMLYEASTAGDIPYRKVMKKVYRGGAYCGTAFPYVCWSRRIERELLETGADFDRTVYDNVLFGVDPLENYLFPAGYDSLDRIPWFSHVYYARPSELLQSIDSDGWDKREVWRYLSDHPGSKAEKSDVALARADLEGEPEETYYSSGEILMCETWMRFALKVSDRPVREVKILVDHPLNAPEYVFRVIPWPYKHGRMKFARPFRYIEREHRMLGMGIPERLGDLTEAASAVVNQIIEGGTINNIPVWSIDENVRGVRQNLTDIYPGKIIPRGESADAISAVKMGSLSPDIFEGYNIIRDLCERLGKVADWNLGRDNSVLKGEGTATGVLALMGENGQYFDAVVRGLRETADDMNQSWLDLIVQYKPMGRIAAVLGEQRAQAVLAAVSLPYGDLRKRLAVRVAFSNTAATRELARQEEAAKMQLVAQYYQGLIQLAQTRMQAPWMTYLLDRIGNDATTRMRNLLEAWGDRVSGDSLPDWDQFVAKAGPQMQALGQMQMVSQMAGAAPGTGPQEPQTA